MAIDSSPILDRKFLGSAIIHRVKARFLNYENN